MSYAKGNSDHTQANLNFITLQTELKADVRPRIVKAFLLKDPGHLGPDLSIQFRPWHRSGMRQRIARHVRFTFVFAVVPLITAWY